MAAAQAKSDYAIAQANAKCGAAERKVASLQETERELRAQLTASREATQSLKTVRARAAV